MPEEKKEKKKKKSHPQLQALAVFAIFLSFLFTSVNFLYTSNIADRQELQNEPLTKDDILSENYFFAQIEHAQTVKQIGKVLIHDYQSIKDIAHTITDFYCEDLEDEYCRMRAIYTYIKNNIRTLHWDDNVLYEHPIFTLTQEQGDNDAINILFANLLQANNIDTQLVFVQRRSFVLTNVSNVPNGVPLEKNLLKVDASCKSCAIGSTLFNDKEDRIYVKLSEY